MPTRVDGPSSKPEINWISLHHLGSESIKHFKFKSSQTTRYIWAYRWYIKETRTFAGMALRKNAEPGSYTFLKMRDKWRRALQMVLWSCFSSHTHSHDITATPPSRIQVSVWPSTQQNEMCVSERAQTAMCVMIRGVSLHSLTQHFCCHSCHFLTAKPRGSCQDPSRWLCLFTLCSPPAAKLVLLAA